MTLVLDEITRWAPQFVSYAWAMLIQSSLVILLLLLADLLLLHRVRSAIRYAVWMLALIKLVLPPTLTAPTSPAYWLPEHAHLVAALPEPVVEAAATDAGATMVSAVSDESSWPLQRLRTPGGSPPGSVLLAAWLAKALPSSVVMLWLGGAIVLTARTVRSGLAARRLVALADAPPDDIVALSEECRHQLGMCGRIETRCTPLAHAPAILGIWNPVILVPTPLLASLTQAQLRAILLHELVHYKRRDAWVNCLQALVQIVHWYNPLVWVANAVIRQAREHAVDDVVQVHMGRAPDVYPETLLHVARMTLLSATGEGATGAAILGRGTSLRRRVARLLEAPAPAKVSLGGRNVILVGAAALMLLPMAPGATTVPHAALCESTSLDRMAWDVDATLYEKRKEQWLACVKSRPGDVTVIQHAADFLEPVEPHLARDLFELGLVVDPDDSRWASRLALQRVRTHSSVAASDDRAVKRAEIALASGTPCEGVDGYYIPALLRPAVYAKVKEQWFACIDSRPHDVSIIVRAIDFLSHRDSMLARELLERGRAFAPVSPQWTTKAARLDALHEKRTLDELALALPPPDQTEVMAFALARAEQQLETPAGWAEDTRTRLPLLAFLAGDMPKAHGYATALLAVRDRWDSAWSNSAVNKGNTVLGRIALREGRLEDAVTFLRRSGELSGPLASFRGPNMSLAKDLLEAGEAAAVLAYFEQCRQAWEDGGELLDIWAADVRMGRMPYFGITLSS